MGGTSIHHALIVTLVQVAIRRYRRPIRHFCRCRRLLRFLPFRFLPPSCLSWGLGAHRRRHTHTPKARTLCRPPFRCLQGNPGLRFINDGDRLEQGGVLVGEA